MQKMKRTTGRLLTRLGLATLLGTISFAVCAETPPPEPALPEAESTAEPTTTTPREGQSLNDLRLGGGLRAHVDPQTGVLTVPPPKLRRQLSSRVLDLVSTSHEGLEVVELPNGLSYVDLKGRFQSLTMATVGDDGKIRIHHGRPESEAAKAATAAASVEEDQP